jgi:hypothetical protein
MLHLPSARGFALLGLHPWKPGRELSHQVLLTARVRTQLVLLRSSDSLSRLL